MYVWRRQTKRIVYLLGKLFFAATIAFSIPVSHFVSWISFLQGMAFAVVAGVGTKFLCGLGGTKKNRYLIGAAMVGRREFAFLFANEAFYLKAIDETLYASILWGLMLTVLATPIAIILMAKKTMTQNPTSGIKLFQLVVC